MVRWIVTIATMACLCVGCLDELWSSDDDDTWEPDGDNDVDCDDASGEFTAAECRVLELVNANRQAGADCGSAGTFGSAEPLTMNRLLGEAARLHSQDMGERDYFAHDSPGGPNGDTVQERIENAGYDGWMRYGENIAAGLVSPDDTMDGWMASDGHCANIMDPNFEEIGVGYAKVSGSHYVHYWTQDFGTR